MTFVRPVAFAEVPYSACPAFPLRKPHRPRLSNSPFEGHCREQISPNRLLRIPHWSRGRGPPQGDRRPLRRSLCVVVRPPFLPSPNLCNPLSNSTVTSAPLVPQRAEAGTARHISVGWTVPATNGAQIATC